MSFALFLVYIAFTYLRPFDIMAPGLAPYRPMLVLWGLAFLGAAVHAMSSRQVAARPAHAYLLSMLVACIAMSQAANGYFGGAIPAILDFSTSAMLMALCMLNLTSPRRLRVTCGVIVVCMSALAALGVYSFHTGFLAEELVLRQSAPQSSLDIDAPESEDYTAPAHDKSGRYLLRLRGVGFLNDPNDFAQALVMLLPLLWWVHRPGRQLRNLLLVYLPGAVIGYAIYLTQSRGALLGVAALGLVVAQRVLGTVRTLMLALAVVAAVGALSFGGRQLSTKEESAAQRIEAWYEGLQMFRSKPVLGVGYGNFTDHHYLTAHNSFVLCFAELGLLGYFAWMGLIVLTYKGLAQAVRLAPESTDERKLAMALRASLLAFLACSWFLSRTYSPGLFVLLPLGISAWYVVRQVYGPPPDEVMAEPIYWRRATLVAMAVSLVGVYGFVVVQRSTG
jgi:putative inorganic carbon (hco3(-)) transporter